MRSIGIGGGGGSIDRSHSWIDAGTCAIWWRKLVTRIRVGDLNSRTRLPGFIETSGLGRDGEG